MEDCTQVLDESFLDNVGLDAQDIGRLKVGSLSINGTFYDIFRGENVIGRDQLSDIVIKSNSISSKHAVIEVEDWDTHILYDCGSTNKTRLGKVVLKPNVMYGLQGGEDIYLADIKAKYIKLENPQAVANLNDSGSETGSESMLNQDSNYIEGDIHEDDSRISDKSSESKSESVFEKSGDHSKSVSELNDSSLFEENKKAIEVSRAQVVDTSLDDSTDDEEFFILPSQTTKQFSSVKQESYRVQSKMNNPILTEDVFGPGMADQNQLQFNSNLKGNKSEVNETKDIFEQETEPPEQPLNSDEGINNGKDQEIYDESDDSQSIFNTEATETGPDAKNVQLLNSISIFEAETQDASDEQIRNNASNQKPNRISDNRDLFEAETEVVSIDLISDSSRDKIKIDELRDNTDFNNEKDIFNAETELPEIDLNTNKKQTEEIKATNYNNMNLSNADLKNNCDVNKAQTSLDNDEFEMSELAVSSAFTESSSDENEKDKNEETYSEGSKSIARSELTDKVETSQCSTADVSLENMSSKSNNYPVGTEDVSDCLTQVNNNVLEIKSPPKNDDIVDSLASYEAQINKANIKSDETNDGVLANCETQVNNANIESNETNNDELANCETQVNNANIDSNETNNDVLANCETQVNNANIDSNETNNDELANCETQVNNANIDSNETNNDELANCETQINNANIDSNETNNDELANCETQVNNANIDSNETNNDELANCETQVNNANIDSNETNNDELANCETQVNNANIDSNETNNDELANCETQVNNANIDSNETNNDELANCETQVNNANIDSNETNNDELANCETQVNNANIDSNETNNDVLANCETQVNNANIDSNETNNDELANCETQVNNANIDSNETNNDVLANCETQVNNANIDSNETNNDELANCETQVNNANIDSNETNNDELANCETQVNNANIDPNETNNDVLVNCETQVNNANIDSNETNNDLLANCETQENNANIESDKNRMVLENETSIKKSSQVIEKDPNADSENIHDISRCPLQLPGTKCQTIEDISESSTEVNSNILKNDCKKLKERNDNVLEISHETVETQVYAVIKDTCDTKTNSKYKNSLENVNFNSSLNNPNIELSLKEYLKNTNPKETDTGQVAKTEITENFTLQHKNENNGNVLINDEEFFKDNTQVNNHIFETKEMLLIKRNDNMSSRCNDETDNTEINEAIRSGGDRNVLDKIPTTLKDDNNIEGLNPIKEKENQAKHLGVEISEEEDSFSEQNTQLNINLVKKETAECKENYSKPNSNVDNLKADNTYLEETQPNVNLNSWFDKKRKNKSEDIAKAATEPFTGCTRSDKDENTYLEETQLNLNLNRFFGQERINESENIAEAATQPFPGGTTSDKSEDSDDTDVDDGIKADMDTKQPRHITAIMSNNIEKNTTKENDNIDSDENSTESDSLLATMPLDIDDINNANMRQSSEEKTEKGNTFETIDQLTEVSSLKIENKLGTKSGKVGEDTPSTKSCLNVADMDICSTVGDNVCVSTISNSDSTRKITCSIIKSKTTNTPLQSNILLTKKSLKPLDKQITSIIEEESIHIAQSRKSRKLFCESEKCSDDMPTEVSFLNHPCSSSTPFKVEDKNVVELTLDSHLKKNILKTPKTKRQMQLLDDSPLLPSTEELLAVADKTPESVQGNSKTSRDNLPLALKRTPRLKKLSRKIADNFELPVFEDNKSKTDHKLNKYNKRKPEMSKTTKTNIDEKICLDVDSDTEAEPRTLIDDIKFIGIDQFSKETDDHKESRIKKNDKIKSGLEKHKNKEPKNFKKSLKNIKIEKEKTDEDQEEAKESQNNKTINIRSSLRSPKKKTCSADLKPSPAKRRKHAEEDVSNVVLKIEKITESKLTKAPEAEIIDTNQTDDMENVSECVFTRATRRNCKTNSSMPEETSNNSVNRKRIDPNNCNGSSNRSGLDLDAIDCDQPLKKVKVVTKKLPDKNPSLNVTAEKIEIINGEDDQGRKKPTRKGKGNVKAQQALNIDALLPDKKTTVNLRNTRRGQKCNDKEHLVQMEVDFCQIKNSPPRKTRRGKICNEEEELVKTKVELSAAENGSSLESKKSDSTRKTRRGKHSNEEEELLKMEEDLSTAQNSSSLESKKSDSSKKTRRGKNCNEEELVKMKVELSKAKNVSCLESEKIQKDNEMFSKTSSEKCKEEETIQNQNKALSFVKTKSRTQSKIKALDITTSLSNKINIKEEEGNEITEQETFDKANGRSSRCRLKPARFRDDSTDSKSSSEPSRKERNLNKRTRNDATKSISTSKEKGNQNSTDNDDSEFTIPSKRKSNAGDSSKVDTSNRRVGCRTKTSTSSYTGNRSRSDSSSSRTSVQSGTSMTLTPRRLAKKGEQVLFTGLSNPSLESSIKTLGGAVVDCPWSCSVLVTDKVRRTVKFLCVLGQGKPIVTPEWILQSRRCCRFEDTKNYLLVDLDAEEKFSFKLAKTLEEAKTQPLLSDYHVYSTPSVKPPPEDIKSIVECCGGQYLAKIPSKWPSQSLIISHDVDRALWKKLKVKGVTPTIVTAEMLLLGVLHHKLDIETHRIS